MSEFAGSDALVERLAADLRPVQRLRPPGAQALLWLALAAAIGAALTPLANLPALAARLLAAPDMWLAALGSLLTAAAAAFAAFQTSLPDRSARWAWLPVAPALLWIGASGAGCLRGWLITSPHTDMVDEMRLCFVFIVGLSLPLTAALAAMLRWACPLRPNLTAALAGLASAAAAATLLLLFHPFDATATDLSVHAIAVALVIGANRALGGRIFGST